MGKLDSRTVVITGAARGQGAAEATLAVAEGAFVVVTDVLDEEGAALAASLGDGAVYRHLDVTSPADWTALAGWLRDTGRPVHGLVNNAGIPVRPRLGEIGLTDWNRAFAINTTGPMLGMQALEPLMTSGGSIVNIGSIAGLTAHHAVAYTSSKWALRGLTKVAALEYGRRGIRVNIVHPGAVDTPLLATANPAFVAASIGLTLLNRAGRPTEIAAMIVFLLSEEASYITGAELVVDGGHTAHGGTRTILDAIDPVA
jgi:3alpha(or 20beta)-hydroxysteroid dehydrogenase